MLKWVAAIGAYISQKKKKKNHGEKKQHFTILFLCNADILSEDLASFVANGTTPTLSLVRV